MLKSRIGQAGVMVGVMGLLFGMVLAPIPNVASEYVLQGVLDDMEFHYNRHQAAFEAYQLTASETDPNFLLEDYIIQGAIDNPSECENNEGDYFQFGKSILDDGSCLEASAQYRHGYYSAGGMTYQSQITDSPPRISFYVKGEGPNSVYIELGDQDS